MKFDDGKFVLPADYGFEVYQNTQDMIVIRQEAGVGEEALVTISVERCNFLIQALQQVKAEIEADRTRSRSGD